MNIFDEKSMAIFITGIGGGCLLSLGRQVWVTNCPVIVRLLCGNSAVRATLLYHVPLSLQSLGIQNKQVPICMGNELSGSCVVIVR